MVGRCLSSRKRHRRWTVGYVDWGVVSERREKQGQARRAQLHGKSCSCGGCAGGWHTHVEARRKECGMRGKAGSPGSVGHAHTGTLARHLSSSTRQAEALPRRAPSWQQRLPAGCAAHNSGLPMPPHQMCVCGGGAGAAMAGWQPGTHVPRQQRAGGTALLKRAAGWQAGWLLTQSPCQTAQSPAWRAGCRQPGRHARQTHAAGGMPRRASPAHGARALRAPWR